MLIFNTPDALKGLAMHYVIVKSTQRSLNPQLRSYGYPKYFCCVYYTSVPHFILLPFRSVP